ncbi:MAG: hypothetical protein JW750_00635 [Anaerolineaceae bacterium]|nr:hypothetical protein [Anaerolineaceae bacterium]
MSATPTQAQFDFLITQRAQAALKYLSEAELNHRNHLNHITRLRKEFSPDEAGWLLDQALLRQKASDKFVAPRECLFIDEALQQASSLAVAAYHAQLFSPFQCAADLGCGIGADSIALASSVPRVIAVELDPVRAQIARFNLKACGVEGRVQVVEGDWTQLNLDVEAAFIDPARRVGGKRVFSLDEMVPPLDEILRLQKQIPNLAVKVAPGIDPNEVPPDAELEFISENGEMKEALLRFGALRTGFTRRATLLPARISFFEPTGTDPDLAISPPRAYLYEPDPAVIRAHLVRPLGKQLNAAQLDPEIAYLTADEPSHTPLARIWQVLDHAPFHLKTLNHWLREHNAGEVVIKKRGSPIDPDTFQKRLKTHPKGERFTVFFTQHAGAPWMILTRENS